MLKLKEMESRLTELKSLQEKTENEIRRLEAEIFSHKIYSPMEELKNYIGKHIFFIDLVEEDKYGKRVNSICTDDYNFCDIWVDKNGKLKMSSEECDLIFDEEEQKYCFCGGHNRNYVNFVGFLDVLEEYDEE